MARFKSNYDYRCELGRRIHSAPQLAGVFSASARIYDSVWYGEHETTADLLQAVLQNRERLEHATTD
ncbi:MAG: DUF4129 domain-containing protein [Candidatus Hydrogenedentes bacterium]|nr:DUF4129 domain-containing protein [Candidatus Hydrogenedentota bacterium]